MAEPRTRLTLSAVEWGLRALALECMSVSRVASALGISWHTANNAILTRAEQTITGNPDRFDGVEVLGVDDSPARFAPMREVPPSVWRHTRRGDRYVTVMIDLTPVRDRSGPARLLDVVPGRSKKVLKTWLAARGESWRGRVEVVAMDGFTGFKSAAGEELPQARADMDPFHVVSLAASKLDQCRRRIQRAITGRRGRAGDRLYRARRTLHTGADLLTDTQTERLETLFADDRHAAVQASWGVYQHLIQAYRTEEAGLGKYLTQQLIDSLKQAIPEGLEEIHTLARTPISRSQDVLAYFAHPAPPTTPRQAINGRLEHLRGIALGFAQPGQLHHPQPHPHQTPQRPPGSNHLNQPTSPTYHTLKHEEPSICHDSGLRLHSLLGEYQRIPLNALGMKADWDADEFWQEAFKAGS